MSIHDRPTARELLDAVRAYVLEEVAPATNDRRARFRALIAANVLAVVERELACEDELDTADAAALRDLGYLDRDADACRRALCARNRAGGMAYAQAHVRAKLRVANPGALAG
jgi:hypothetical protein